MKLSGLAGRVCTRSTSATLLLGADSNNVTRDLAAAEWTWS